MGLFSEENNPIKSALEEFKDDFVNFWHSQKKKFWDYFKISFKKLVVHE